MLNQIKYSALRQLAERDDRSNRTLLKLDYGEKDSLDVYPKSIHLVDDTLFWIARSTEGKHLYISTSSSTKLTKRFDGDQLQGNGHLLMRCPMTSENRRSLQEIFEFTRPRPIGNLNSFGFGDRLGVAGAGHLRSVLDSGFAPILAQQSIRELQRTGRTPEDVMDAAVWAVFQEGWHKPWGSDADHLKTTADVDLMMTAGFTMFTIDPSDHVENSADKLPLEELVRKLSALPWEELKCSKDELREQYARKHQLPFSLTLSPCWEEVMRAAVKYGNAVAHAVRINNRIRSTYPDRPYEIEISVDETIAVTTPFEHFFVASELKRLNVDFVSLAPHFVGGFEKGIDYRGDLEDFKKDYRQHLAIAEAKGPYKLSIHSGSDKFGVYAEIGKIGIGTVHVKTAGTSYLEALRTLAVIDPDLFREIFEYARGLYEVERKTYHVSADLKKLPDLGDVTDAQLPFLLNNDDERQVLHVTFGRVLTDKGQNGELLFYKRIMKRLNQHEFLHQVLLQKHFLNHLSPFSNQH